MTGKRFQKRYIEKNNKVYDTFKEMSITDELNSDSLLNVVSHLNGLGEMIDIKIEQGKYCMKKYKELEEENGQLKKDNEYFQELLDRYEIKTNDFDKFMNNREHTRLSINLETGELQRHIYATGNWFGDFDRVLVTNWLDEESYHRFIDRVIEVFNTEFKKELEE